MNSALDRHGLPATRGLSVLGFKGAAVMDRVRDDFRVDVPFLKKAPTPKSGDLVLEGYANTWGVDRDGELVQPSAFDTSLPAYLEKNPIVLWQHNPDWPIGRMLSAETDDTGLRVKVVIPKPEDWTGAPEWLKAAYQAISSGVVTTFSIGGYFLREMTEDGPVITDVELLETSVVSIPANADSIFEAAQKSLRGQNSAKLTPKIVEQMGQVLGCQAVSDPELAHLNERGLKARESELAGMYKAAGLAPPSRLAWKTIESRWEKAAELSDDDVIALAKDAAVFARTLNGQTAAEAPTEKELLEDVAKRQQSLQNQVAALAGLASSQIQAVEKAKEGITAEDPAVVALLEAVDGLLAAVGGTPPDPDADDDEEFPEDPTTDETKGPCPSCGETMNAVAGAKCPNCGYALSAAEAAMLVAATGGTPAEDEAPSGDGDPAAAPGGVKYECGRCGVDMAPDASGVMTCPSCGLKLEAAVVADGKVSAED